MNYWFYIAGVRIAQYCLKNVFTQLIKSKNFINAGYWVLSENRKN